VSGEDLFLRVECYVGLRRALGYVVRSEEKLLKDFVRFVQAQAITGPIRAQMALDWCSVARYSRKFSHVNCDGSFGTESGISTVLSIC
jgi:hypothetical protein